MHKRNFMRIITVILCTVMMTAGISAFISPVYSHASSSSGNKTTDRSLLIYTQRAGDDNYKRMAYQCSVSELKDMVEKYRAGYVYQYYAENADGETTEHAVIATDTVPFDLLFKNAGLSKYWYSGSRLVFTTENGTDRSLAPDYNELQTNAYYFDENGSHAVPSGLAVSWREGELKYGTESVKALAVNAPAHVLPRLVYGVNEYQYSSRTPSADRLTDNIVSITIVYPDEPQNDAYTDNKPLDSALTVSIQNGDAGERIPVRSYTAAELRSMAETNENGYIYQYYNNNILSAVVATEVALLDSVIDGAGVRNYWTEGSKLSFITNSGKYTDYYPAYDEIKNNTSYIGINTASGAPCGFALTWDSGVLTGNPDAVEELAESASTTGSLCFVYGINYSQYREKSAASKRMPTGVTEVTVVYTNKSIGKIFNDVSDDDWFSRYVTYVYYNDLMNGKNSTEFDPYGNVTRAQFITVLFRAAGDARAADSTGSFADVPEEMYYRDSVVWGTKAGIINGVSDTEFDPDGLLSREQVASFLYRYARSRGIDTLSPSADLSIYSDVGEISEYAYDAVSWAIGSGLLNVQAPDSRILEPREPMRRADLAAAFSVFCERFL